jgi:hypothetical protein
MGRFSLNIQDDDESRRKGDKTLVDRILSAARVAFMTTLLAYLIVLGWMHLTGDSTLWWMMGFA